MLSRRTLLAATALAASPSGRALAAGPAIRIGVLNDQSGPYRDLTGPTSVACVKQAVADMAPAGLTVEVLVADHGNKADVAASIARGWLDRDGVDVIVDVPGSAPALAVSTVVRERNKVFLSTSAGAPELTTSQCSPNTVHWSWDTYMLSKALALPITRAGGKKWYFIAGNYAAAQQLARDAGRFATEEGGQVVGTSSYPFPETTDFSSFLISAQSSGADVLGLANSGTDTTTNIKQAAEFGLSRQMRIAALVLFLNDVHSLGLEVAQGLLLTEAFYWDLNDRTRALAGRVSARTPRNMPSSSHMNSYAACMHYLKGVAALGTSRAKADGKAVVDWMKANGTDDDAYGACRVRADGQAMLPAHLFQVKTPAQSRSEWDCYTPVTTVAPEDAFRPSTPSSCGGAG